MVQLVLRGSAHFKLLPCSKQISVYNNLLFFVQAKCNFSSMLLSVLVSQGSRRRCQCDEGVLEPADFLALSHVLHLCVAHWLSRCACEVL